MADPRYINNLTRITPVVNKSPYTVPNYETGFLDDVANQWKLFTGPLIGQAILDSSAFGKDFDPNYDIFEDIDGYENYILDFLEVRNKDEADVIKRRIDRSNSIYGKIERSPRNQLLPMLIGGVLDPVNWVGFPVARGASFGKRFLKGGVTTGAVVGALEPVRLKLDPNATTEESLAVVGTSFLLGGAISGFVGRGLGKTEKKMLKNSGGMKGLAKKYDKAFDDAEGNTDFSGDYIYNPQDDASKVTVKYNYEKGKNAVRYDAKTNTVLLNDGVLKLQYANGEHILAKRKGVRNLPNKAFRSVDDYINFRIKKEIYRAIYPQYKRKKGDPFAEYENQLNSDVLNDLEVQTKTARDLDTNAFMAKFFERTTNFGKVLRTFKNDVELVQDFERGFGDFGTPTRNAKQGVSQKPSALLETLTYWFRGYSEVRRTFTNNFIKLRKTQNVGEKVFGVNPKAGLIRTKDYLEDQKDKVSNLFGASSTSSGLRFGEYGEQITRAKIDPDFYADPNTSQAVKDSADALGEFFRTYAKEASELNMFASQKSFARMMEKKRGHIEKLKKELDKELNPLVKARIKKQLQRNEQQYVDLDTQLKEFELNPEKAIDWEDPNYFEILYRKDKILDDLEGFRKLLTNYYTTNPEKTVNGKIIVRSTAPEDVAKRVQQTIDNILDIDSNFVDAQNAFGIVKDSTGIRIGAKPLMSRNLDIPRKLLFNYIETDPIVVARHYYQRMSKMIELTRTYGDAHLDDFINRTELRLTKKYLKKESDNERIDDALNAFIDQKDIFLGVFNTTDPASLSKRSAQLVRNWSSLAYMGSVTVSAISEVARPFQVNGFRKTFGLGFQNLIINHHEVYRTAVRNLDFVAEAAEIASDTTRNRFIADGGEIGFGKSRMGRAFDRFVQGTTIAQVPFYWANLLTPWTRFWKNFQGMISAHRIIEDSLKIADGTATEFEITRLAGLGIDIKTAKLISSMPFEKLENLYTSNALAWDNYAGGATAKRAFSQAIFSDVNRVIVTPTIADQPNMMHGAFRVNEKTAQALMKTGRIGKIMGFNKTSFGGKIDATWPALFFQFMAWGMAANNKLLMSGLSGRDANFAGGVVLAITLGGYVASLRNPYFSNKDLGDQIAESVDRSGVLALYGDMNFMLETITGGLTERPIGARPLFGLEPRFGEPDELDALDTVVGAGPSIVTNILAAFSDDYTSDEKRAMLRRLVPLNNMILIGDYIRAMFDAGYEEIEEL